jgi:hypothetical protein
MGSVKIIIIFSLRDDNLYMAGMEKNIKNIKAACLWQTALNLIKYPGIY